MEQWDVEKLLAIFSHEAVAHIVSVHSPNSTDIGDQLFWKDNSKHTFVLKNAYEKIAANTWDTKSPVGTFLWSLQVSQWLRLFLWIAFKQNLMTNVERCCRSIGGNLFCQILCGLWRLESRIRITPRNEPTHTPINWIAPHHGWICLNVDGAVSEQSSYGTVDVLFRDHEGTWFLGFNKAIGITHPFLAELWAILIGLQISWNNSFELLLVKTDSRETAKLLNVADAALGTIRLVRAINKI
ncbi:hypothetical protein F3Y22_tig00111210pilonHSYRG00013 [Hibiscus syriacus]|uniref:RNase H type-1 domain-containing protein n=1 Tax=Hibiscus syriacus TaxID=106335 RepID=A0A6A2YW85_HIBSY|nr:hypothetical protein F3Y22_tig00111210pilonHSYRG00013 [Hibiscus syriacus]